mmetsp:Transcript_10747/g.12162  ORF Transcript_10747/g.12162 Transcript_10747/m.12162 type:complete len:437 (-) Transcript_10747:56-1366(-)
MTLFPLLLRRNKIIIRHVIELSSRVGVATKRSFGLHDYNRQNSIINNNKNRRNLSSVPFRFNHKTVIIPHDEKKFRGGEDGASTKDHILVVADGVGGWAHEGVNPGLYSRKLTNVITTKYAALMLHEKDNINNVNENENDNDKFNNNGNDDNSLFDLKALVHEANNEAAAVHLGSATCTVVRLKDAHILETLNIGDSGYSIHRRYPESNSNSTSELQVVYASVPGTKGFNFPFQLGGQYGDQVHDEGVADGPKEHTLQDKDVIVVVSDGVIDNIDPHEYHDCINRYTYQTKQYSKHNNNNNNNNNTSLTTPLLDYSAVADCIARKAYFLGKDESYVSPFTRSAAKYGKHYLGGKHDDITVTVAQVEIATLDEDTGIGVFRSDVMNNDNDANDYGDNDTDNDNAAINARRSKESIFVYTNADGPIPPYFELSKNQVN